MHETVVISPKNDRVTIRDHHDTLSIKTSVITGGEPYDGPYELTPTSQAQTLGTTGKLLAGDITVGPIPSNYGLIEWSGSALRVS